jgi:hypothetical protein
MAHTLADKTDSDAGDALFVGGALMKRVFLARWERGSAKTWIA